MGHHQKVHCAKCDCVCGESDCGPAHVPYLGLCTRCYDKLNEKLTELALSLPSDAKRQEWQRRYGTTDARKAYVLANWGRPRLEDDFRCNRCNCIIAAGQVDDCRLPDDYQCLHCPSCQRIRAKERAREQELQEREYRKKFGI